MRQANQAIQREKNPVPTVEETLQEMSTAKVFTKLDLNMTFHQIELSPASRDITTFAAPNGLHRYTRLLFGVNMATEKFQNLIWQVLKACPGTNNLHDDILVVGKDQREHDRNLEKALQKLEECGLTLNYDKCIVGVESMVYMGDTLSSDGLQLSKERVKAIAEAPAPKNQSEVTEKFLGLCTILRQVHTTVCHCIGTPLGPDLQKCQMEMGHQRSSSILENKVFVNPSTCYGLL
jgi:hypothetical protein